MPGKISKIECENCTPGVLATLKDSEVAMAWTSMQMQYLEATNAGASTDDIVYAGYWIRRELQKRNLAFDDNTDFAIQAQRLIRPEDNNDMDEEGEGGDVKTVIQVTVGNDTYTMWIMKGDNTVPYAKIDELPETIRGALSPSGQKELMKAANEQLERGLSEEAAIQSAWGALKKRGWVEGSDGKWAKVKKDNLVNISGEFIKFDAEQRLVFGWANVSRNEAGELLVDSQDDTISPEELEKAAYDFVLDVRKAGEMHQRVEGIGTMVESVMLTLEKQEAMGIPAGTVPEGWWVGFKVAQDVFDKVKTGEYSMFSIGGRGIRSDIDE